MSNVDKKAKRFIKYFSSSLFEFTNSQWIIHPRYDAEDGPINILSIKDPSL
jgi:hypothetical protein